MPDIMTQAELFKLALLWGPGLFILYGLYRLMMVLGANLKPFGERFILAQQAQAQALTDQAAATRALNQSFQDYTTRDNAEHREMLIVLKMIAEDVRGFRPVKEEHNRLYGTDDGKCGGPNCET